jgi:hypothetical protein
MTGKITQSTQRADTEAHREKQFWPRLARDQKVLRKEPSRGAGVCGAGVRYFAGMTCDSATQLGSTHSRRPVCGGGTPAQTSLCELCGLNSVLSVTFNVDLETKARRSARALRSACHRNKSQRRSVVRWVIRGWMTGKITQSAQRSDTEAHRETQFWPRLARDQKVLRKEPSRSAGVGGAGGRNFARMACYSVTRLGSTPAAGRCAAAVRREKLRSVSSVSELCELCDLQRLS